MTAENWFDQLMDKYRKEWVKKINDEVWEQIIKGCDKNNTVEDKGNTLEAFVKKVEQAIKSGRTDSELELNREVYQKTKEELIKDEQIDHAKLQNRVNI